MVVRLAHAVSSECTGNRRASTPGALKPGGRRALPVLRRDPVHHLDRAAGAIQYSVLLRTYRLESAFTWHMVCLGLLPSQPRKALMRMAIPVGGRRWMPKSM